MMEKPETETPIDPKDVPKEWAEGEMLCADHTTCCPASGDGICDGGYALDGDIWLRCHGPADNRFVCTRTKASPPNLPRG